MKDKETLTELADRLGVRRSVVNKELDVNPLRLLLSDEFGRSEIGQKEDYRIRAFNRAIKANVYFQTEQNTVFNLVPKFLNVINPKTKRKMEYQGGGGNGDFFSLKFVDPVTKDTVTLRLPPDAISFSPREGED